MKEYRLVLPKDEHGQPMRLFRLNAETNGAKAVNQLSGICAGILSDGVVNEQEANFFADWVRRTAVFEPIWPFTDLLIRINRIFEDGYCDDDERAELKEVMESLCGQKVGAPTEEPLSATLPLDNPQPEPVVFANKMFSITGKFAFGIRRKVIEAIEAHGGRASDTAPNRDSHYLVIGVFASRDWIHASYGRKIQHAVKLRDSGSGLAIVSEEHWKKYIVG
jgi:NAD-dependent DNA ligase